MHRWDAFEIIPTRAGSRVIWLLFKMPVTTPPNSGNNILQRFQHYINLHVKDEHAKILLHKTQQK